MRKSIYKKPAQSFQLSVSQAQKQNDSNRIDPNNKIQSYLNMRRITKDKICFIIFLFYSLGLIIMLGIGFFYGNFSDISYFVNNNALVQNQVSCNGQGQYLNQQMNICQSSCPSNFAFLNKVCLDSNSPNYNPQFDTQVSSLISIHNLKYTFPMIIYVSIGLLVVTALIFLLVIYFAKLIYLLICFLFFMLLGMAFYLLKNFEIRTTTYQITDQSSIFYTEQQSIRGIAFFLLGIYLVIFPFILFSPQKIQLAVFLISKIKEFYKEMVSMILFSLLVVLIAWGGFIIEIFLVINFYSAGTISKTPSLSMFHTYETIYLSNPAALTFHFIGVFWVFSTLISWHKYFISSSMCLWYFQDSQKLYPVKRGLKRSIHHIGSAALDGILMPFEWILLLFYSIFKVQQQPQNQNEEQSYGLFLSLRLCFTHAFKCINRNSPSCAVLTNQNYFESCSNSTEIFSTNQYYFFNIGGTLTIFLTLFVSILWILIMYLIVYFEVLNKQFPSVISSILLPLVAVFLMALVIGSLYSNIFTATIDSLIFCYLMQKKTIAQGDQFQRSEEDLMIKKSIDEHYIKSKQQSKKAHFIYEQKDENTMQISYIAKRQ